MDSQNNKPIINVEGSSSTATVSTSREESKTPPTVNLSSMKKELSSSSQQLTRNKSQSNISRLSFRQTFRQITTRIQVANRLSMAKRAEDQVSYHGSALIEEPCSGSKIIREIVPSIVTKKSQTPVPTIFYNDHDGKVKEGIISGGNLIFDVDYPMATDAQKRITRPYIYVTPDVEMKNITDLMFDEWHLSMPRIALFLLTDPDHFRTWHNARQIASFKAGIMKAAKTTSMWLVTNGLDVGVGKLIGDALIEEQNEMQTFRSSYEKTSRKQFPVIGITNDYHLSYSQEFFGSNIQLGKPGPIPNQRRYELNSMHSNFLLIQTRNSSDDCYQGLMTNLIDHLTKRTSLPREQDDNDYHFTQNYIPSDDSSSFPRENFLRNRRKLSATKFSTRNTPSSPSSNIDPIIVRPSYDQKTNCFAGDEDMIDSHPDEDETSFISPEGTVIEDEHVPPPVSPILETDATSKIKDSNEKMIPVVCLVIQGDYSCAKLILDNIRRRNTSFIVLYGTGGLADILSYAYIEMQRRCGFDLRSWDVEFVEQTLKPLLAQKIVKHFPEFRNNALARNTFRDRIIECVRESVSPRGRVYLSVLNLHNSSCDLANLPEFILLSLFKSQNRHRDKIDSSLIRKDLYLTIDWNCPLVALDEVLGRNPTYNLQLEKSIFEIAILKSNREDFVDLFLSHGFRIHKYLTPFRLLRLIRYSLVESDFFRTVCMEAILGVAVWSVSFEELLERLATTSSSQSSSDPESFLMNEFNQLIFTTTSLHDFVNVSDMYLNIMGMYPVDSGSAERKALATLAMWAAFNRRFKLVEILWKHSDQPIHLGLIISMILDRMAWFVPEQNLKDDLQNKAKIYAKFAINVLDACYRNDEQRGYDLLGQKNSDWDKQTAVDIAANGQHRAFIAHPCCQKWLTNTFNGRIRVRELSWGCLTFPPVVKIILSAFLILPMYIWIRFLDINHQWTVDKNKLLEELNKEEANDSDDDDDELLVKAVDELKLMPLNNHQNNVKQDPRKKSNALDFLVDNQMTITSIDNDDVRAAIARLTRKMKKRQGSSSSYERKRNNLFIDKQPPLWTMINLMWNSPITKFWTHQVLYIFYLALLSLAVIWPGCGNWQLDTTVCIWTFLMVIEHISRLFVLYQRYTSVPMFFRILETILLVIFLTTYTWGRVLIVYTYHINGHWLTRYNIDPYMMKVILSAGLLYFYYRMFYIHLPISPTLGPLLYRFKLMVSVDFIHFMRMALILLISSGVIIQALLYPNTELSKTMFHKAFHRTIVSLFTTPVDELTRNCTSSKNIQPIINDSIPVNLSSIFLNLQPMKSVSISAAELCPVEAIPMERSCPVSGFWSYFFTFQFLICLKLILMTLLYALFSSTATKLQTETDNIWKYQRYILVIDFANRPALEAPLSIFKYLYLSITIWFRIFRCVCCFWKRKKSSRVNPDQTDSASKGVFMIQDEDDDDRSRLSKEDYNYWRHLAKAIYDEEQRKEEEKQMISKQGEVIQLICEEMEHEKNILRTLKTKMNEFERMMYQTQIYLENIKNSCNGNGFKGKLSGGGLDNQAAKRIGRSTATDLNAQIQTGIHYLSRLSPYAGTRIQRFPVADKYVSWDVIWINYDPVIYSRKKENFPTSIKSWVDEDLLAMKEQMKAFIQRNNKSVSSIHLPVFNWNAISVNPAGLTIDRRSWIKQNTEWDILDCNLSPKITTIDDNNYSIYKLDEDGIPMNFLGRTGLRGKGNLPRWGPNHYVMLIVSRSRILSGGTILNELALERRYSSLFTPMRFIGDEKLFSDLAQLFSSGTTPNKWNNLEDLMAFFHSIDQEVQHMPSQVYYLDSPENTDNAWKEVKVYHFHYGQKVDPQITDTMIKSNDKNDGDNQNDSRKLALSGQLSWIGYYEDMLVQLPMEQVSFINDAMKRIQNWDI